MISRYCADCMEETNFRQLEDDPNYYKCEECGYEASLEELDADTEDDEVDDDEVEDDEDDDFEDLVDEVDED